MPNWSIILFAHTGLKSAISWTHKVWWKEAQFHFVYISLCLSPSSLLFPSELELWGHCSGSDFHVWPFDHSIGESHYNAGDGTRWRVLWTKCTQMKLYHRKMLETKEIRSQKSNAEINKKEEARVKLLGFQFSGSGQATTASTTTCIPNSTSAIQSSALAVLVVRQQNIYCSPAPSTSHSERESGKTTLP